MAFRFYRNNRSVPPLIAFITICLLYLLIDPSANRTPLEVARSPGTDAVSQHGSTGEAGLGAAQDALTATDHPEGSEGGDSSLGQDDVLLILKTGATVMWRRLPIHMTTTLAAERIDPKNVALYSDVEARIGNHTVVDILGELARSPEYRDSPAFELYRAAREYDETNNYVEQTGLPGDDEGPPGGWRLDKYKFLPVMQHAGANWPDAKWYIYTEDDTYLFLPNLLRLLARLDHHRSHWLGGLGEKLGTTFAHGGSGFALSRGAWERSFGKAGASMMGKYRAFVDGACCGDYVLGKVLNDYGVRLGVAGGPEAETPGFNGLPHWKIPFSVDNWCRPVLTWHHAHNRDIAMYNDLERSWDFSKKALNHGDFYAKIIAPTLQARRGWWDNFSSRFQITSTTVDSAPRPQSAHDKALWDSAWRSVDACEAACRGWKECLQWYYYGDDCKLDDRIFQGHGWAEGMRYRKDKLESVSGWLTERVEGWRCE